MRGLGIDGARWRRTFGPIVERFDRTAEATLRPALSRPDDLNALVRFGLRGLLPASVLARRFETAEAQALFAGNAAHLCAPLTGPLSSAIGVLLSAAGDAVGWPVAVGGSARIAAALASHFTALGGTIETGRAVTAAGLVRLGDLGPWLLAGGHAALGHLADLEARRALARGRLAGRSDDGYARLLRLEAGRGERDGSAPPCVLFEERYFARE